MNVCTICNKVNDSVVRCGTCSALSRNDVFLCDECQGFDKRLKHVLKKSLNDFDVRL
jgi:hypothetical protein